MPEFEYADLLPMGEDTTPYRLVTSEGVSTFEADGRTFLKVEPEALRKLAEEAIRDIQHYLRPAHLAQLRRIIDDPEASGNDKFVALDLLKNANIAAAGVLPMCQDTGTAIVMGKRGQNVLTSGRDEEALSKGIYDAYQKLNLRYSQMAPLTMWEEKNTGSNLPAQIELYATDGGAYKFLFMAKGGGSANKSFLYQETKAVLNEASMMKFLEEKIRSLGTAACPPYHLAIVVGGTSAEYALKTAKYASAHYLDEIPAEGSPLGHGFRDKELEEKVFELTQKIGIGAQFGGKYFCHDVRVVRLPRHGASCPVAIAVSCSADRQAVAKITAEGVFLEQLETDPARFLPETTDEQLDESGDVVKIDLNQPMKAILAELTKYPVKTRLSLSGPLVVARDIAHGGTRFAWLGGNGSTSTESVGQTVTVPAGCTRASLDFWLWIETAESGSRAYDTFSVRVNGSTLATWSNVHAGGGWTQRSADLSAYAGQTVTVTFTATEDHSLQTGFLLDDVSLSGA
ncbi:hypothetical protein SALBM217S_08043 [Streptomyces griseoloalbus]